MSKCTGLMNLRVENVPLIGADCGQWSVGSVGYNVLSECCMLYACLETFSLRRSALIISDKNIVREAWPQLLACGPAQTAESACTALIEWSCTHFADSIERRNCTDSKIHQFPCYAPFFKGLDDGQPQFINRISLHLDLSMSSFHF